MNRTSRRIRFHQLPFKIQNDIALLFGNEYLEKNLSVNSLMKKLSACQGPSFDALKQDLYDFNSKTNQ